MSNIIRPFLSVLESVFSKIAPYCSMQCFAFKYDDLSPSGLN